MQIRPTFAEFEALAADHSVVPVWAEVLADLTTPVAAFARVVGEEEGFLLESVDNGDRWSRWSFIGRRPQGTLVSKDGRLRIIGDLGIEIDPDEGMLNALERLLAHYRAPDLEGLPPLHGGLIGYLGYDVVREVERLPNVPTDDLGLPDAVISMIGELAVYDHWRQRVTLLANVIIGPDTDLRTAYDDAVARIEDLAAAGARAIDADRIQFQVQIASLHALGRSTKLP